MRAETSIDCFFTTIVHRSDNFNTVFRPCSQHQRDSSVSTSPRRPRSEVKVDDLTNRALHLSLQLEAQVVNLGPRGVMGPQSKCERVVASVVQHTLRYESRHHGERLRVCG
jgi:hypothetical protein